MGQRIIYRKPDEIANEIDFLVKQKSVNYVFFCDDNFLVNGKWAHDIAEQLLKRQVPIKYHVMASVRSARNFNHYDILRKSGCSEITLGMESINKHILDKLEKGFSITAFLLVANKIVAHNIHLGFYYMLGYPEQTLKDLENDLEFIKKVPFSRIRPVFITPFPGTRFYDWVEENNSWLDGYRNNWSMLTCDQPVIKSNVPPEKLIEARNNVIKLYFSLEYKERMISLTKGETQNGKAFEEFQNFLKGFI